MLITYITTAYKHLLLRKSLFPRETGICLCKFPSNGRLAHLNTLLEVSFSKRSAFNTFIKSFGLCKSSKLQAPVNVLLL